MQSLFSQLRVGAAMWVITFALAEAARAETPAVQPAPTASQSTQQDSQPDQIPDVVVTAEKHSEVVQKTPLAITALTGEQIRKQHVNDILDLSNSLPNVNINILQNSVHLSIRGIGLTTITPVAEGFVAFHIDGVYVSMPESQSDTLFDINRIEVTEGPQGTLYGRNATGGAVNVITNNPTETFQGYARITLGNYESVVTEEAISGPIANGVSARFAMETSNHDGYGFQGLPDAHIPLDNLNTRAFRAKVRFEWAPSLTTVLSADYFHQQDASGILTYIGKSANGLAPIVTEFPGGELSSNPRNMYGNLPSQTTKNDWGLGATTVWAIAPYFNLTSITGYRHDAYGLQEDYDESQLNGANYYTDTEFRQFSEELRADGKMGPFTYLVGAYYLNENLGFLAINTRNRFFFGGPNEPVQGQYQEGQLYTQARAIFSQISYEFTRNIGIDLGVRYSDETAVKTNERLANDVLTPYNPAVPPHFTTNIPYAAVTNSAVTPKATVRYTPLANVMLYATYAQGFESGSFVLGTGGPATKPETLVDYEGGLKSDWFDRRLQADLSVFHYNYTNLQVQRSLPNGNHITDNAGLAEIDGVEASLIALPVADLRLNLNVGYNDSRYVLYSAPDTTRPALGIINLVGKELVEDPKYRIIAGAEYTWHPALGNITLRGEGQFVARTYFTAFNAVQFSQAPYAKFDAYIDYTPPVGRWYAGLYVKNITNQTIVGAETTASANLGAYVQGVLEPPRTFGVTVGMNF